MTTFFFLLMVQFHSQLDVDCRDLSLVPKHHANQRSRLWSAIG